MSSRCTGPRTMPPAPAIPGFRACGGAATALTAWGITNNAASTRDLYRETLHPDDKRRYRDGDDWRAFDERRSDSGAWRGATDAGHPLDRARSGGERAGHAGDRGRRSAAVAALGRRRAHRRSARRDRGVARAGLARIPRRVARLVGRRCSISSMPTASGNIGYQMAGRMPVRGRVIGGFRDADNPAERGRAISVRRLAEQLQSSARLCRERQPADCRAGRCRSRSTGLTRRVIAACASTRHSRPARRWTARRISASRTT